MKRKIAVTGIGLVSSLGSDLDVFWQRVTGGKPGVRTISAFDATEYDSRIAGEVVDFDPSPYLSNKERRRMDLYCVYGVSAAKMAMADAGIDMNSENPERAGVIIGSGIGGVRTLQEQHAILLEKGPGRCSPFLIPQMISDMAAGNAAIALNMKGPNYSVVSACASALHAIGNGMRTIERGDADIIVAGGCEAAVCELGVAGFCAMKALSTRNDEPERASRPFDAERDGFVIAEGAGMLILEEMEHAKKRGADIYCEAAGFGATCDAFHMTAPCEDGEGAMRVMRAALKDSRLPDDTVSYINAHGTSTQLNDKAETAAIKAAFGEQQARKLMISSSKSMTGHMLGAAAGVESAVCALAIKHNIVPPTINYENPDPECDLDYVPNTAREAKVTGCLNNSFGFGGHNACLMMVPVG